MTDPFAGPAVLPTTHPTIASLRGRLVLITPTSIKPVPDNFNKGAMKDQITADVSVVDGLGPVPGFKNFEPTGLFLDGPDFRGVWLDGTRVVDQLRPSVPGRMVLARIETYQPGTRPGPGNPWGLIDPTEEDKQIARTFLANRTVAAASAPAAAPVQAVPAYQPQAQAAPVPVAYVPPAAPPALPAPGSAPAGVNPFA